MEMVQAPSRFPETREAFAGLLPIQPGSDPWLHRLDGADEMSGHAMAWAERQILPANHALALRTIASSIHPNIGRGWKGQETMAGLANGVSLATFKRCLRDLRQLRLVTLTKVEVRGKMRNTYQIDTHRLVRWNRKLIKWRDFMAEEVVQLASRDLLPGESRQAFVRRTFQREGIQ